MKALNLTTDNDIKNAYENASLNIYFREGSEGDYESAKAHDLDTLVDATCHGFELIAVEGYNAPILKESDIDLDKDEVER